MNEAAVQTFLWSLTALSLLGTALNVKKLVSCFYIWTAVNAAWIGVDAYQHLCARMVLDAVRLVFAVWGIFSWRRREGGSGRAEATGGSGRTRPCP